MSKRITLGSGNDNSVYLEGFLDETDAKNVDGSPKWINDATVTWQLLDSSGNLVSSGTAISLSSGGRYRCDLGFTINYTNAYRLVVTAVKSGKKAVFEALVDAITRTGETLST